MTFESQFLIAFLLTQLVEVPVVVLLSRYVLHLQIRLPRIITVAFLASALTLPYLWFVLPAFVPEHLFVSVGESLVFVIEAFLYWILLEVTVPNALLLSLTANLLSYVVGRLILG